MRLATPAKALEQTKQGLLVFLVVFGLPPPISSDPVAVRPHLATQARHQECLTCVHDLHPQHEALFGGQPLRHRRSQVKGLTR